VHQGPRVVCAVPAPNKYTRDGLLKMNYEVHSKDSTINKELIRHIALLPRRSPMRSVLSVFLKLTPEICYAGVDQPRNSAKSVTVE